MYFMSNTLYYTGNDVITSRIKIGASMKLDKDTAVPLYSQLIAKMRQKVLTRLAPGEAIPSERILCQMFHVSRITVRNALEELTVNGEIYKVHGKGTFKTRNSVNQIRELVYVIYNTSMISSPGREKAMLALAQVAEKYGYHFVIRSYNPLLGNSGLRNFALENINGGLLVSVQELSHGEVLSLQQGRVPCVFMNQKSKYSVCIDYEKAGKLAAQWCKKKKFRKIFFLPPKSDFTDMQIYMKSLQNSLPADCEFEVLPDCGYDRIRAAEVVAEAFRNNKLPDGVICGDDIIAAGVMDHLKTLRRKKNIQICGMNNSYLSSELQFTSLELHLEEHAKQTGELLVGLLEGKIQKPLSKKIMPDLIEREV